MAKDKIKPDAAAADSRGELKQFKIYLPENDMEKLTRIAGRAGIKATLKARMIIIEYLDKFKE